MKNTVPFTLGDYPLDLLNQAQMRQLKKIADEKGVTISRSSARGINRRDAAATPTGFARHTEISCVAEETPQGAAKVQPAARVGPTAAPMRTLLFRYQIAVWRVLGSNSR